MKHQIQFVQRHGLFFLVAFFYVLTVFATRPFIQQEIIGLAHFWTSPKFDFFTSLFDPLQTDGYPGRFRYVEYLTQGFYWKFMKYGLLPNDLYDYFSFLVVLGCYGLVYKGALEKKLSRTTSTLLAACLILSVPAFMVSVFHFRKAKVISALFLLLLRAVSLSYPNPTPKQRNLFVLLCFLGFITDPFFILMAPLLVLTMDYPFKNGLKRTQHLGIGYLLATAFVLFMLGYLGPQYHPEQGIFIFNIPGKPDNLLSLSNLAQVLGLVPDLFFPLKWVGLRLPLSLICLGLFCVPIYFRMQGKTIKTKYCVAFLFSLLIATFCIVPNPDQARFSSYYGLTLIVFLVFALEELVVYFQDHFKPHRSFYLFGFLILWVGIQQHSKGDVFLNWKARHFSLKTTAQKWERDYQEVVNISNFLKHFDYHGERNKPYPLVIDYENLTEYSFRDHYEKKEEHLKRERTTLAYFLFPILYYDEIGTQKIQMMARKNVAVKEETTPSKTHEQ